MADKDLPTESDMLRVECRREGEVRGWEWKERIEVEVSHHLEPWKITNEAEDTRREDCASLV